MAEYLTHESGFDISNIKQLVDERVSKDEIIDSLYWLISDLKEGDKALFFSAVTVIPFLQGEIAKRLMGYMRL